MLILAGFSLPVLFFSAWKWGLPAYQNMRESRASAHAQQFLAAGDLKSASVAARQALNYNPNNAAALEVMVRVASETKSTQVLEWQKRLAKAAPTLTNRLALGLALARLDPPPFDAATALLTQLRPDASNNATFHLASAELAVRQKDLATATTHFEAITHLEPTNLSAALSLSTLRLQSDDASALSAARATLGSLRSNTDVAPIATRLLVQDALRSKDLSAATGYSRELVQMRAATFDDLLQHATLLASTDTNAAEQAVSDLMVRAATNAASVYALGSWMLKQGRGDEADAWWQTLPEQVKTNLPAPLAHVDYLASKGRWLELETFLQKREWGDAEFLRLALLSQTSLGLKEERLAETRWRSAQHAAAARYPACLELLRLARVWGRPAQESDVLWLIAQRFPGQHWAYTDLDNLYLRTGDTRGLQKLYTTMLKQDPTNVILRNNVAAVGLLLDKDPKPSLDTAQALHTESPTNPVIASTYAFALYRQGDAAKGLDVLSRLDPALLEQPSFALYQAVMLLGLGRTNEAARYVQIASSGQLLPEERALLPTPNADAGSGSH